MRHRGKEISLCLIGRLGFSGCGLKALIKVKHIEQVAYEQDQQANRNNFNQCKISGLGIEITGRNKT